MKINTKLIIKVLVCIFALYGLIILVRKLWNRNENNAKGNWNYYVSEQYRYMNDIMEEYRLIYPTFSDFKTQFVAKLKEAIAAPTFADKKQKFNEAKALIKTYLDESPKLQTAMTLITNIVQTKLQPLIVDKLNDLIFDKKLIGFDPIKNEDIYEYTLKRVGADLCRMGKQGTLFQELVNTIIDPAFGQLMNVSELQTAFNSAKMIGVDIVSIFKSAIKTLLDSQLGEYLTSLQDYLSDKLTKTLNREISCKYDPKVANALPFPPIPSDAIAYDFDASDL